jgi:hypothetical protein
MMAKSNRMDGLVVDTHDIGFWEEFKVIMIAGNMSRYNNMLRYGFVSSGSLDFGCLVFAFRRLSR